MIKRTLFKIGCIAICLALFSCIKNDTKTVYYLDGDGDGFGDAAVSVEAVEPPAGYTENNLDCNDSKKDVNPDATEVFNNTIDENCDGEISKEESFGGDVILCTQQDVDDFGRHNYKTIYGRLQIGKKDEPNTSIVSLAPLQNLRVVTQKSGVHIYSNHALKNLEGLDQLHTISGMLEIEDNILLENLSDLSSLRTIGNDSPVEALLINENPSLTSLEGLGNLTTADNIVIMDNRELYDFCSLVMLKDPNFPSRHDVYNPDFGLKGFRTGGNRYNPDVIAMREDLCNQQVDRLYDANTLENLDHTRYAFLKKGEQLISIEGILTDFGTSETNAQAYTYQIGETADWYVLKVPQDYNEKSDFYDLLVQSGFYDTEPFGMLEDDNYAATVIGLGLNANMEAYIVYEDDQLRSDLGYPNPGTEHGLFGTWFGSFQNDEAFVLPRSIYQEAAYPEIKKFPILLEELNIELNALDTVEFMDFQIFR